MNQLEANLEQRTTFDLRIIREKAERKRASLNTALGFVRIWDQLEKLDRNKRAFDVTLMVTGAVNSILDRRDREAVKKLEARSNKV